MPELDRLCRLMATRGSATLPDDRMRFINTEPSNLFFHSHSDIFVEEFINATPEALRGKTVMEITERTVIDDFPRAREIVKKLREAGFRIAIDDAGAGYSGLQTMVEIEPDFIKLDMSLTRHIEDSVVKQKLVKTLHDFCDSANVTLIAEGIETETQLESLRTLGVSFGQGYYFAHPGSPYPITEILEPAGDPVPRAAKGKSERKAKSEHKPDPDPVA